MPASMQADRNEWFARESYRLVLGSEPDDRTVRWGTKLLEEGCDPRDFLLDLVAQKPVRTSVTSTAVPLFVEPGHFYSPVVDPTTVDCAGYLRSELPLAVDMPGSKMAELFHEFLAIIPEIDFPEERDDHSRYYYNNDFFGAGDALILSCFLRHFRPRRVIEVGSGFSSAVILDNTDQAPSLSGTRITFIEPHPERLDSLISNSDQARAEIIRAKVQDVSLERFEELERDDILFLDTTHVAKTGSDVNFEFFEIFPRLRSGVIIHLHDIFDRFEYPPEWAIHQNRSWNELYLLRAFLMYNEAFEILFFNHHFITRHTDLVRRYSQRMAAEPGGSLWLRKI